MARRKDVNTRIGLEVKQQEAENRRQFRKIQTWARETQKQLDRIGSFAKKVGLGIAGVLVSAATLFAQQERAERKLAGALRQTGQDVERLTEKYKQLASDVQATTTFGDEDLLGAASTLTRLAQISEQQMPEVLRLTADWATFLDKDVNSAARDVGRVLADPVRNMSLLSRYGVQVDETLKSQVETLINMGKKEEARLLVMAKLQGIVEGVSRELADTDTGKWVQLKNLAGDILELIGERLMQRLRPLADWLTKIATKILDNQEAVKKLADILIYAFTVAISAVVVATVIGLLVKIKVAIAALGTVALAAQAKYAAMFATMMRGGLVALLTKVRLAIAALGTASMAARLKFALMWGGLTLGLSLIIPWVINNWDRLIDTFFLGIEAFRDAWDGFWKELKARWINDLAWIEDKWVAFKSLLGFEDDGARRFQRMEERGYGRVFDDAWQGFRVGLSDVWQDDNPGDAPKTPDQGSGLSDDDARRLEEIEAAEELANEKIKQATRAANAEKKLQDDVAENDIQNLYERQKIWNEMRLGRGKMGEQYRAEEVARDTELHEEKLSLGERLMASVTGWITDKTRQSTDFHNDQTDRDRQLFDEQTSLGDRMKSQVAGWLLDKLTGNRKSYDDSTEIDQTLYGDKVRRGKNTLGWQKYWGRQKKDLDDRSYDDSTEIDQTLYGDKVRRGKNTLGWQKYWGRQKKDLDDRSYGETTQTDQKLHYEKIKRGKNMTSWRAFWGRQKKYLDDRAHSRETGILKSVTHSVWSHLRQRYGFILDLFYKKKAVDRATARSATGVDLAILPYRAFARTLAAWGWPWGILAGYVAYRITKSWLKKGLGNIGGMNRGGLARGGQPGQDSIHTMLTPGELVTPVESYDEHIDAVASQRDYDLAMTGGSQQTQRIVLKVDGRVLSDIVTDNQKRNRVYR